MKYCCVPLCKSKGGKSEEGLKIGFHEFPAIRNQKDEWITAISRKGENNSKWRPSLTAVVCSVHFRPDDYDPLAKVRRLKPGVVPTLFPNHPSHKQIKVARPTRPQRKRRVFQDSLQPASKKTRVRSRCHNADDTDSNADDADSSLHETCLSVSCQTDVTIEDKQIIDYRKTIKHLTSQLTQVQDRLRKAHDTIARMREETVDCSAVRTPCNKLNISFVTDEEDT